MSVPGFGCVCIGLLAQELALGLQSMFPLVRVFFPLGQAMHVDISEVGPYFPLSQVVQLLAPSVLVYLPAGQARQVLVRMPICDGEAPVYLPGWQAPFATPTRNASPTTANKSLKMPRKLASLLTVLCITIPARPNGPDRSSAGRWRCLSFSLLTTTSSSCSSSGSILRGCGLYLRAPGFDKTIS